LSLSLDVIKSNNKPIHVQPANRRGQNETERNKERRNKKFIIHKEKKFRSNENSKDRKMIRLINNAVSTAQLKKIVISSGKMTKHREYFSCVTC